MSRDFRTRPTYLGTNLALVTDATATGLLNVVEVNLGTVPRRSGHFDITTSGLTVGQNVIIEQINGPYTGKGTLADEAEMDQLTLTGQAVSTTVIRCYWVSPTPVRGNFKFAYTLVSILNTVPEATTTTPGLLTSAFQETYISGLTLEWVSTSSVKVKAGAAWVPGAGKVVNLSADVTLVNTTDYTLSTSKWYYVYLTNSATISVVRDDGTNPLPVAYKDKAKNQTSNTNRRYLGAFKTSSLGNILKFRDNPQGLRLWLENQNAAPFVVINDSTTIARFQSCAPCVPVSSRTVLLSAYMPLTTNHGFLGDGDISGTFSTSNFTAIVLAGAGLWVFLETTTSQEIWLVCDAGGGTMVASVVGYVEER